MSLDWRFHGRAFAFALAIFLTASFASKYVAFWGLQKKLGVSIEGKLRPSVIGSRITIYDAKFIWKDKVKFLSGDLDLRYDLAYFLLHRKWHIQLESSNAKIALQGEWEKMQGAKLIALNQLKANLVFDNDSISDVVALEAHSSSFHFSIK